MGCRLHLQTKHEIEYSQEEHFNWQQQEFQDTLDNYGVYAYGELNEDGVGDLEIDEDSWEEFLKDFENDKGEQSEIKDYTFEEQLEIFKSFKPTPDGYLHLTWF